MTPRLKEYALTVYNSLKANSYRWKKGRYSDAEKSISRLLYDQCHSVGPQKTGLTTVPKALHNKDLMADDHYMTPQSATNFIYDNDFILNDFDKFFDFYISCLNTCYVLKSQNQEMKTITKKNILTKDRYKHLGYPLYKDGDPNNMVEELPVPEYYTEWERGNNFKFKSSISTLEDFIN
tara:strand:+ start:155 stop:691 length:537 start_codon:yes stop_codon:yes gene_type:complete